MTNQLDGKKVRDSILKDLADKVAALERKPTLAVLLVGNDPVCAKYVELKQRIAVRLGVQFCLYKFEEDDNEDNVIQAIEFLNNDPEVDGIMIQIPMPEGYDRDKIIAAISPAKDVDGLRYCLGVESKFKPPVVLAVLEVIKESGTEVVKSKIALVGHGFLVGKPLEKTFQEYGIQIAVANSKTQDLSEITADADILISAVGEASVIRPENVKERAVLIDAGTTEASGTLKGDIDHKALEKASFYTPVPGGIGPVTVAMLFRNLIER